MRYELRLAGYTVMDRLELRLDVDETPDAYDALTVRSLAMTASVRIEGTPTATEWTREALLAMLAALGTPAD